MDSRRDSSGCDPKGMSDSLCNTPTERRHSVIGEVIEYDLEVTAQYAAHIQAMHWLHEGHRSVVHSQLEAVHRRSTVSPSKMRVIDIACGEGNYARTLVDRYGYERVVGVDKSQNQVDLAMNLTASSYSNVEFHQMNVPSDVILDVESLGGPFDIALANWLLPHAHSKRELLQMMQWTNRMMKPGGTLIAWTVGIEFLQNADDGVVKDAKFGMETHFEGEKKEGLISQIEGDMEYFGSIWSFNTYHTVLEVAGFEAVHFLEDHEYVAANRNSNCSEEERVMFNEIITWKGCILKALTAIKREEGTSTNLNK